MALRDQPYITLYVQDYLTDEKLNSCLISSQGVFIKIMCILHKQKEYGTILIKQKDKQTSNKIKNFALKFAKLLPLSEGVLYEALNDLIEEDVLQLKGDVLSQKRMVKDFRISLARSKAGKKGGGNPNLFKQKDKQIPEDEYECEYKDNNIIKRKDSFIKEVKEYVSKNPHCKYIEKKFIDYWTEPNKSETKFRREKETFFDIGKRFGTFLKNNPKSETNKSESGAHEGKKYDSKF